MKKISVDLCSNDSFAERYKYLFFQQSVRKNHLELHQTFLFLMDNGLKNVVNDISSIKRSILKDSF